MCTEYMYVYSAHCLLYKSVSMYCLYVNCFCTVWSTLSRISLTKARVLCWCDSKNDLIWLVIWPLYTDSYQIFHCVWMKGCSSAVLLKLLWSRPPLKPINKSGSPSHLRLPNSFTKHYEKKVFTEKTVMFCLIISLCSYCIWMQPNSQ